jgi:glycosyltransferase 2 family protein
MKRPRYAYLYILGLALGGLAFFWQIWIGIEGLRAQGTGIDSVSPLPILACGLLLLLVMGIQILAWKVLMSGLGAGLLWRDTLCGYPLTFLARYIPGSVWGYFSRSYWLQHHHQISYSLSIQGSVLEVGSALTAAGMVLGTYLLNFAPATARYPMVAVLLTIPPITGWILGWVRERILQVTKPEPLAKPASKRVGAMAAWITSVGLYCILWLGNGSALYLLLKAWGFADTSRLLLESAIFAISWLAGFVVLFVPSGLGIREMVLSGMLVQYHGLTWAQAGIAAVTFRLLTALSELTWILVGAAIQRIRGKSSIDAADSG